MKTRPLATAAIAATAATSTAAAAKKKIPSARHRNAFVKAMRRRGVTAKDQTPTLDALVEDMSGDSKRARSLRKKVMGRAKPVGEETKRRLQNYNNQANGNANAYRNNNAYSANQRDGADDYFPAYGEWSNAFGFDPTQYSLSYARCASVKQFDDAVAAREDTDSVFATKQFAVFRFCPSKTCEGVRPDPEEEEWYERQQEYYEQMNRGQYGGQGQQQGNYNGFNGDWSTYEFDMYYNTFEDIKVAGANGDGCQSNYGEYMLELEDYLDIMNEYHTERFEKYCETCEECMYDVYQTWLQQGGQGGEWQNRKLKDIADESWMDDLEGEDFERSHRELGYDPYKICPEYDTCRYYQQSCKNGIDETFSQYFQCTEVERNNGNDNNAAYVGPRCAEDGTTITLGIFADQYCNEYIGDGVDIANYLGFELEGDELAPYVTGSLIDVIPEEGLQAQKERYSQNYDAEMAEYYRPEDQMCIPCMASRQPYEVRGTVEDYEDQEEYDDDVNELCTNLYLTSARCDKHFRSYNSKSKMAKYAEAVALEDLTCDFIESVVVGNYDADGYPNADNMRRYNPEAKSGMLADSMLWEQYGGKIQEVSPLQIFGLIMSILAIVVLGVWAMSLDGSLRKVRGAWRPRKAQAALDISGNDGTAAGQAVTWSDDTAPSALSDRNRSYYAS